MKRVYYFRYKIHYYFLRPVISFLANLIFWSNRLGEITDAISKKEMMLQSNKDLQHVESLISTFQWTKDKWIDWKPWIITLAQKNFRDDCDGAATLGKFLLENLGYKTNIWHLKRKNGGHAIAVTENKKYMVSNNDLRAFMSDDTELELDMYFNGRYESYFVE